MILLYLLSMVLKEWVPRPGSAAPPGSLLQMQVWGPHHRPTEGENRGAGAQRAAVTGLQVILVHTKTWETPVERMYVH